MALTANDAAQTTAALLLPNNCAQSLQFAQLPIKTHTKLKAATQVMSLK